MVQVQPGTKSSYLEINKYCVIPIFKSTQIMKNKTQSIIGALFLATSLFFASCDVCKDVTCVNGECVEGDCICEAGYEGVDCGTALNAKFSGSFSLTETCSTSGNATYAVTVAPKSDPKEVNFTGLWEEPQAQVTAIVEANGTSFSIEKQALGTSGFDISATTGSITADGATITISYTIYSGSTVVETCTGSMAK